MKIGIDIIEMSHFKSSLESGGDSFINKNFSQREFLNSSPEKLAGKFACKEALYKAAVTDSADLRDFEILNDKNGAPFVVDRQGNRLENVEISISHTDQTAIAVVINLNSK